MSASFFRNALLVCALASFTSELPAQAPKPATLVILGLPAGTGHARPAVYVKPGFAPEAVIAFPAGGRASDLARAFIVLSQMRHELAASRRQFEPGTLVRVDVPVSRPLRLSASDEEVYAGYIASFARAPEVTVPGVGTGRAVEVIIPNWPAPAKWRR